jgi:hypothetical protein
VGPFLDYLHKTLPENDVVTHCGDDRFPSGKFPERSSVVFYLFTKSSTEKFSTYTRISGFDDFLYGVNGKCFIPVLGDEDIKLPLGARVGNPLPYWKDDKTGISSKVIDIYEKYRSRRLERERYESENVNTDSENDNEYSSEVTLSKNIPTPKIHANGNVVVIGDNNKVFICPHHQ